MQKQNTSHILMIRPVGFGFNSQTATNNHYQTKPEGIDSITIQQQAQKEFTVFAEKLRSENIDIIVVDDTLEPQTPDSIFPNNWVSFHADGTVVLYPMFAQNRREERRMDILETLRDKGFVINQIIDLTHSEKDSHFLEGTGSLVLDRESKIAYACISTRTDKALLIEWAQQMEYEIVAFHALQNMNGKLQPIYHTNVMMSVGREVAVVCTDSIKNKEERKNVLLKLEKTGKEIINITEVQKLKFAGNMLQIIDRFGKKIMTMSTQAFDSLNQEQIEQIERENRIVHSQIKTIETLGGGSARCMMAEVFLPLK